MFVVVFEVQPRPENWQDYLNTAALLRPELERIDGFIDNERFRSLRREGRLLSLSSWRTEKALVRWRAQATHHVHGQRRGRLEIFAEYHLRVAEVALDTHPPAGMGAGQERFDVTEVGRAKILTLTETLNGGSKLNLDVPDGPGLIGCERYESIATAGKHLLLAAWMSRDVPAHDLPRSRVRHRIVRVIRDYGMYDRREAPQYLPDPGQPG